MGLFLQGFGLAKGSGLGDEQRKVELKRTHKRPVEILVLQSMDHPVTRQVKEGFQERLAEEKGLQGRLADEEGFQERLAEEEGLDFRFLTYDVKGKFANTHVLAQLLSRKEVDLVLAIGPSAAQTATLASKLKVQMTAQGESEAVASQVTSSESAEVNTQASAAQTATLASKLKAQMTAQGESEVVASQVTNSESEAVNTQRSPKREGAERQCGLESAKADTQAIPALRPTPIVLTAVTDPFYLHILSKNAPLEHVYGVLDLPPLQEQLRLMRLLLPGLERLGVVYSEDAVNLVKFVEDLKEMAEVFGIDVLALPIRKLEDVAAGYAALAPQVEAFFIPMDDRLLVQLDLILALANKAYLPVFASDTASVEKGALAALGYNYHEGGRMAAELALRALHRKGYEDDASLEDLPRLIQQKQRLTLNQKTARRLSIVFPASILRAADSILD